jgi:hypothetical protein
VRQEKIALIFGYLGDYVGIGSEHCAALESFTDTASTTYGPDTVEGKLFAALDDARGVSRECGESSPSTRTTRSERLSFHCDSIRIQ